MLIIGMPYFLIDLKIKYLIFKKYFQDLFSNDQRWSFRAGIMPLFFFFKFNLTMCGPKFEEIH